MKHLLALALFVAVASCFKHDVEMWKTFKEQFNKNYTGIREENKRRAIFEYNVNIIAVHNVKYDMGLKGHKLGLNKFGDLSNVEFRRQFNGYRKSSAARNSAGVLHATIEELPKSVNWTEKGAVTGIKDQGQCGSCWAFSTTGSIEGQHFLKTKNLVSLSEQNLVDCSVDGNTGCHGGLMDDAFKYVINNKGIDTEDSYPYTATDNDCHFKRAGVGATISSFKDLPIGDENALQTALATIGPISVAIDASQETFQFYQTGVYDEEHCSSFDLDHGVLAVGYGTDSASGKDYWLVKNSWGTSWGLSGYILMSRNKSNQCGIATQASYPII